MNRDVIKLYQGDVTFAKTFAKVGFNNVNQRFTANFRAHKGKQFITMFLGTTDDKAVDCDPEALLKELGFVRGDAPGAWQPMDTAPKDGREVLLYATIHNMLAPKPVRVVGRYLRGWWMQDGLATLSHVKAWMPLPEVPAE